MFKLKENSTTVQTEVIAGLSTFFTMVYVLSVHPALLSETGMSREALFTVTALASLLATLIMALWANLPFAVAPGMGINAFFALVVVKIMGYTWQQALAAVFIAGVLFFLFSISPFRAKVLDEVPISLKYAVCGGVGLMLAGIGLIYSGFIVADGGFIKMMPFSQPNVKLVLIGLFITGALLAAKFRYALLTGIVLSTIIGIPLGVTDLSVLTQRGIVSLPPSISPLFGQMDFSLWLAPDFIAVVFSFLFIVIIDSLAGFLGLLSILGPKEEQYRPLLGRAFMADSLGVVVGAVLGTSPNTTYGESGVGIASGGRTGLTALTVSFCFLLALFLSPLFLTVPFAAVTPALLVVGWLMAGSIRHINFNAAEESLPAVVGIALVAFTWKIPDSLGISWLLYILMKVVAGKFKDLNPTVLIVGLAFALKFLFL